MLSQSLDCTSPCLWCPPEQSTGMPWEPAEKYGFLGYIPPDSDSVGAGPLNLYFKKHHPGNLDDVLRTIVLWAKVPLKP